MARQRDVTLGPDETRRLARSCGRVSVVLAALCLVISVATWRPLATVYSTAHPWHLTCLELAVWFAITAWLCFRPPFHGILLVVGGFLVAFVLSSTNSESATQHAAWPVALGPLAFTAGGLLVMMVSKISTEKHHRRSYWQEARPGVALVLVGVAGVAILFAVLPPPPVWVPPQVIPGEATP